MGFVSRSDNVEPLTFSPTCTFQHNVLLNVGYVYNCIRGHHNLDVTIFSTFFFFLSLENQKILLATLEVFFCILKQMSFL